MKREEGLTEFFNCSSAGAGSGEFHLYRQMRRKEANRQAVRSSLRPVILTLCIMLPFQILNYRKIRDDLNEAFHQKLEENEKAAEEKTAKKRQKRQKKKANNKKNKKRKDQQKPKSEIESESDPESEPEETSGNAEAGGKAREVVKMDPKDDPLMKEPPKKAPLVIPF